MRLFGGIIVHIVSNAIAILAAAYFIQGFIWQGNFLDLIIAAGILTLINALVRPVLKLFLGPFIVLTLGLFIIVINAITLYLLDLFVEPLIIQGYPALIFSTLLFTVVNTLINFSAKTLYRK